MFFKRIHPTIKSIGEELEAEHLIKEEDYKKYKRKGDADLMLSQMSFIPGMDRTAKNVIKWIRYMSSSNVIVYINGKSVELNQREVDLLEKHLERILKEQRTIDRIASRAVLDSAQCKSIATRPIPPSNTRSVVKKGI